MKIYQVPYIPLECIHKSAPLHHSTLGDNNITSQNKKHIYPDIIEEVEHDDPYKRSIYQFNKYWTAIKGYTDFYLDYVHIKEPTGDFIKIKNVSQSEVLRLIFARLERKASG